MRNFFNLFLLVAALICSMERTTTELSLFAFAESEEAVQQEAETTESDDVDQEVAVEEEEDWEEETEEEQQPGSDGQQAIDAERMERVFQLLSEECQEEMQKAYTDGGGLSEACTEQIQNAFRNDFQQQTQATAPPREYGPDPTPYIIAFLAICFVGVGVKVFNIQQELNKIPPKKTKPISKRKAAKMKLKEQRKQGAQIN